MNDNITLPRQTVQQALDALEETTALCINYESVEEKNGYEFTETKKVIPMGNTAITTLKAALGYWDIGEDNPDSLSKHPAFRRAHQQQAEPVQEPMAVTREMISAAHAVTMKHNEVILSASMLERIYMAMNQAAMPSKTPFDVCLTCEALARTVMLDQTGRG